MIKYCKNNNKERKKIMRNKKVYNIVLAAVIAALYVVLTYIANFFGLANKDIQVRFSEMLCVLPYFTPVAIPALFVGCLLANILIGAPIFDIIFGSFATLIGAFFSYLLRKNKALVPIPPIIANMLIIPPVLIYAYELEGTFFYFAATVGIGEIISCAVLGLPLLYALERYGVFKKIRK